MQHDQELLSIIKKLADGVLAQGHQLQALTARVKQLELDGRIQPLDCVGKQYAPVAQPVEQSPL